MFQMRFAAAALVGLLAVSPSMAQEATDYLGVPGPITVGGTDYVLAWSSNPQPGYFKQEYLPEGAAAESYESMVLVEFLASDMALTDVVSAQINMVNARKGTDPVANSAVFQNEETDEFLLDFLLSAKDQNGEFILEWNGYRYAEATFEGERGSILFGVSERAYGNDAAEAFLGGLRDFKAQRTLELTQAEMPQLN